MAETELTDVFVELADTLTTDFDVVDFLHLLTQRCTELLDVDTAGLLLSDPSVAAIRATSDRVRHSATTRTPRLGHGAGVQVPHLAVGWTGETQVCTPWVARSCPRRYASTFDAGTASTTSSAHTPAVTNTEAT